MSYETDNRTRIKLLKEWRALRSNELVSNPTEFIEKSVLFKQGTVFIDYGKPRLHDANEDCVEDSDVAGWCYIAGQVSGSPLVHYCNFHAYVLDNWRSFPEWFSEVER